MALPGSPKDGRQMRRLSMSLNIILPNSTPSTNGLPSSSPADGLTVQDDRKSPRGQDCIARATYRLAHRDTQKPPNNERS